MTSMIWRLVRPTMWLKKLVIWWFQWGLTVVLVFLLVLFGACFVGVMFSDTAVTTAAILLGLGSESDTIDDINKNAILSFIGIAMGGVLIALQASAAYRRAKAMEDTSGLVESGQRQERMKNAIEHLGHKSDSVRLGGAHELFHLAEDSEELRQTILDILCAHIRRITNSEDYKKNYEDEPSEETQSLLTLLFVRDHRVFSGRYINLKGSRLNGVKIPKARLTKADLRNIRFVNANLIGAEMQDADLRDAIIIDTELNNAEMQGTILTDSKLTASDLTNAKMQGAYFLNTDLEQSDLSNAKMQAACFFNAKIQDTNFNNTQVHGAVFSTDHFDPNFESMIRNRIDKKDDFSDMHFANDKDRERILQGIVTGSYNTKDARKWIYKYKDAVAPFSEV